MNTLKINFDYRNNDKLREPTEAEISQAEFLGIKLKPIVKAPYPAEQIWLASEVCQRIWPQDRKMGGMHSSGIRCEITTGSYSNFIEGIKIACGGYSGTFWRKVNYKNDTLDLDAFHAKLAEVETRHNQNKAYEKAKSERRENEAAAQKAYEPTAKADKETFEAELLRILPEGSPSYYWGFSTSVEDQENPVKVRHFNDKKLTANQALRLAKLAAEFEAEKKANAI